MLSLVVSTKGRRQEFVQLFDSLELQTFNNFELLVVEQNCEPLLGDFLKRDWKFPIHHLHTAGEQGVSRGRNRGLRLVRGKYVLFPDDDCWYPATLFERAVRELDERSLDALTGRPTSEDGRTIGGRFEERAQWIDRANLWTTQIEWLAFWRRSLLERVGGYDEIIGVGALSPWQSAEGQDLMLRSLSAGGRCWFDPQLNGHDASVDRTLADPALIAKARRYGRGMGFVMKKHGLGFVAIKFVCRSISGALLAALRGQLPLAKYFVATALGRLEGFVGRRFLRGNYADPGTSVPSVSGASETSQSLPYAYRRQTTHSGRRLSTITDFSTAFRPEADERG